MRRIGVIMTEYDKLEYKNWIKSLKTRFKQSQIKAAVKVNSEILEFYWNLGADIVAKQKNTDWGSGFIKQISADLIKEFPDVTGFSFRNIKFIRQWYLFYYQYYIKSRQAVDQLENQQNVKGKQAVSLLESSIGKQVVSQLQEPITKQAVSQITQIPWGHNILIVQKSADVKEALFYVSKTIEYGWSRAVLAHQIESQLYKRECKAITNFKTTLPKLHSDLANELIKDPYHFDFFSLKKKYSERQLEDALLDHITKFLLELGAGFAFISRQKIITVGKRDFKMDLLFYHTIMHCYVVVELKVVDFEPEFAGKLNFYITAVDKQIKTEKDEPTIGILICKDKDKTVVEYALNDIYKPMAVSEYHLTNILPDNLKDNLPNVEELKSEINKGTT